MVGTMRFEGFLAGVGQVSRKEEKMGPRAVAESVFKWYEKMEFGGVFFEWFVGGVDWWTGHVLLLIYTV